MVLMALPSVFGSVASVIAAVLAVVAGLTFRREEPRVEKPHDWQAEVADITLKVRSPWQYRARQVDRWMRGE